MLSKRGVYSIDVSKSISFQNEESASIMVIKSIKLTIINLTFCGELLHTDVNMEKTINSLTTGELRHKHQHRFEFCYCAKFIHGKAIQHRTKHACLHMDSSMNMLSARIYPSESAIKMHFSQFRLLHTGSSNPIFLLFSDSNSIII